MIKGSIHRPPTYQGGQKITNNKFEIKTHLILSYAYNSLKLPSRFAARIIVPSGKINTTKFLFITSKNELDRVFTKYKSGDHIFEKTFTSLINTWSRSAGRSYDFYFLNTLKIWKKTFQNRITRTQFLLIFFGVSTQHVCSLLFYIVVC